MGDSARAGHVGRRGGLTRGIEVRRGISNAYFICGFSGYLAGLALVNLLAAQAGLDATSHLVVSLAAPISFLLAVKGSQIVLGDERIVFYELAIVAVGATVAGAVVFGSPVASLADLSTLGVGTFLAFGRVGCFQVGCCHGRRTRRGVIYREEQVPTGFPARWVGLPVFPIQLVDATLSAGMVAIGVVLWWTRAEPGIPTCAYAAGYGLGRFAIELVRGDGDRPMVAGVSEAQWTALATTVGAALWHPTWWSIVAAAGIGAATVTLVVARHRGLLDRLWLAGSSHVAEVAGLLGRLADGSLTRTVTREGVNLTAARLPDGRLDLLMSRAERPVSPRAVAALAAQLGRPWTNWTVTPAKSPGLVHLILEDGPVIYNESRR
jgi:hypothetical protein